MTELSLKGQALLAAIEKYLPQFDPLIPLAQAVHETGWFNRVVGENNYWGIQKPKIWSGRVYQKMTCEKFLKLSEAYAYYKAHEVDSGAQVPQQDPASPLWVVVLLRPFIDWATPDGAICFWASLVRRKYPEAWAHPTDAAGFYDGLLKGLDGRRWATDWAYADKVLRVYNTLKTS